MARSLKYRATKLAIKLFGSIQFHKYPFWMSFGNTKYKVRGPEQRHVINIMKPGDMIFRRYDGYINSIFIPGYFSHAALIVDDKTIIHATTHDVVKEDILTFFRTDRIALARMTGTKKKNCTEAVQKALNVEGTEYDFEFKSGNEEIYCFELCWEAWYEFLGSSTPGKPILADDLLHHPKIEKIHDSRDWQKRIG